MGSTQSIVLLGELWEETQWRVGCQVCFHIVLGSREKDKAEAGWSNGVSRCQQVGASMRRGRQIFYISDQVVCVKSTNEMGIYNIQAWDKKDKRLS